MTEALYYRNDRTGSVLCRQCWDTVPVGNVHSHWRRMPIGTVAINCTACKRPVNSGKAALPTAQEI